MEHKDVEAEIKKKCEKCGFSGGFALPHSVRHRPMEHQGVYTDSPRTVPEAMVFVCTRCGYEWEVGIG